MKEWKEKEVILGLVVIILLGSIALGLLIKREMKQYFAETETTEESAKTVFKEPDPVEEEIEPQTESPKEDSMESVSMAGLTMVTEKKQETEPEEGYALYDILGEEYYISAVQTERKQEDHQLKELYEYWDAYKLDAVTELIRLERMQKISDELAGTHQYYYYGSTDRLGRPSGKGLAVYADNAYYFGEWKEGMRSGKGMWLEVAVYTEENQSMNLGVVEHSYNGQWSRDLPNGEGQEHFSYDNTKLAAASLDNSPRIANVIGGFKDGYYDGEMYIMTTDEKNNTIDWGGNCTKGVWEILEAGSTTDAVWESYEKDENGETRYHYLFPEENKNNGIYGLKKDFQE